MGGVDFDKGTPSGRSGGSHPTTLHEGAAIGSLVEHW